MRRQARIEKPRSILLLRVVLALIGLENGARGDGSFSSRGEWGEDRFRMVRIRYDSVGGNGEAYYYYEGRLWQRWETDFPRAELNFLHRLAELTSLMTDPEPLSLSLTDPRLLSHPFIFMSDVGWQRLGKEEQRALRAYLEQGGFLWVDDFWGDAEWEKQKPPPPPNQTIRSSSLA